MTDIEAIVEGLSEADVFALIEEGEDWSEGEREIYRRTHFRAHLLQNP